MRALELEFQAFGPYYKKQTVDFTKLGKESIFLITGPTGSGKTTIFDSICYALYGKASGTDRDQNSLRSHFAEPGYFTEVKFIFELKSNKYKVLRRPQQERHRKQGEGLTTEPAKAILYVLDENKDWKLISSKINEVNNEIEKLLQFDYDQFSKMVLIPQGEFRKLITENSRERERILQKIFQTHFYELITHRFKDKADKLEEEISKINQQITIQFSQLTQFKPEFVDETIANDEKIKLLKLKIKKIYEQIDENKKNKKSLLEKMEEITLKLDRSNQVHLLFEEKDRLQLESESLLKQKEKISQKREVLQAIEEAQLIKPFYDQMIETKEQLQYQKNIYNETEGSFLNIKDQFSKIKPLYIKLKEESEKRENLRDEINQKKQDFNSYNKLIEKVKEEEHLLKQYKSLTRQSEKEQDEIDYLKDEIQTLINKQSKEIILTKKIFEKERKITELEEINELIYNYRKYNTKEIEIKEKYNLALHNWEKSMLILKEKEEALEKMQKANEKHQIAQLRATLEKGKQCVVCGSTDHLYTKDDLPIGAEFFSIREIKEQRQEIDEANKKEKENQTVYISLKAKKNYLTEQLNEVKTKLEKRLKKPLIDSIELNKFDTSLKEKLEELKMLKKESVELEEALKKKVDLEKKLAQFKANNKKTEDKKRNLNDEIIKIQTTITQLKTELSMTKDFNLQKFEKDLKQLQNMYKKQKEEWLETEKKYIQLWNKKNELKAKLQTHSQFIESVNDQLEKQNATFLKKLKNSNFQDVKQFEKYLQKERERAQLKEQVESYYDKLKHIRLRIDEIKNIVQDKPRPNLQIIKEKQNDIQKSIENIQKEKLTLTTNLNLLKDIHNYIKEFIKRLKKLEDEYYIVGYLKEITGGNNAYKLSFERYVLATFLDEILLQANLRLSRMTEHRFELIRSEKIASHGAQSGLDLEVIDYYTGTTRSVKTLSGGEGFKAALSLALGLQDVVQANIGGVQMDTMFIDEGFGTLDEQSLQQAIDCLKDLQDSNRLLGIISHVPQLKDEIHAKLKITPSSEGSTLNFVFSGE